MKFKNIQIEGTSKDLSGNSGLVFLQNLWERFDINAESASFLPKKRRNCGISSFDKFKTMCFSFFAEAENLDDVENLGEEDKLFKELCKQMSAKSAGNFLRSFKNIEIEKFEDFTLDKAMEMRLKLFPEERDFTLSMDSTDHEQFGLKMEGVAKGYKKKNCLNSQNCYDQFGFSYGFDLRPGNTHSSVDSELWINKIFKKVPKHLNRYFRADRAYAKKSNYNQLINCNVKFAMPLRSNIVQRLLIYNQNMIKWKKTDLYFFDSDKCELSQGLYPLKDLADGKKYLRVVFLRAPKKENDQLGLFEQDPYIYYCLITNIDASEMNPKEIINFYRGRANCENFIKSQKQDFDFYHFPCQKLDANRAYGLMGTFTYNFMRFLSFFVSKNGCFGKRVRKKLIKIPGIIIKHSRILKLRFNRRYEEVFRKTLMNIQQVLSCPLNSTS